MIVPAKQVQGQQATGGGGGERDIMFHQMSNQLVTTIWNNH